MSHDEYKRYAVNYGLRLILSFLASKTNTVQGHSVEFNPRLNVKSCFSKD